MDEIRVGENGAKMVFQSKQARTDTGSAKSIIEAERAALSEKTARLRAARLAREAGEG